MTATSDIRTAERMPLPDARSALFVAILSIGWISVSPFTDLGSADSIELSSGNNALTYAVFGLFAAAAGAIVWRSDGPALKSLLNPSYIALAGWVAVTCIFSQEPKTSLMRAAMLVFIVICSMSLFLLPRTRDDFARNLGFVALAIIGLSYFGLLFMPQLAIHQATDVGEPQLAGDWRGLFGHKNVASQIFSILAFIGIFLFRIGRRGQGGAIFALSAIFVAFSGGKTSTGIFLATIVLSLLASRAKNLALWSAIVFCPLLLLNLLGIGTIIWPGLASVSALLPLDSTFTGRTDIWMFAVPKASEALLFGHGFLAFWNTEALRYGMEQSTLWAGGAAAGHNGYLDAVLEMGLPGLALTLAALAIQPARDIRRACASGSEPEVTLMFLQIWMFSLYLNSLESFFFERANPSWIALLFAVFGLRYLAQFRIVR